MGLKIISQRHEYSFVEGLCREKDQWGKIQGQMKMNEVAVHQMNEKRALREGFDVRWYYTGN